MYNEQREMCRVNSELQIKFILFLNKEDDAGIKCEDRNDGFYTEDNPIREFLDGYKRSREDGHPYEDVNNPEEVKMMDDFISIVERDLIGGLEYTSENFEKVLKAVEHFGL